ncbi:hypothetical protein MY9_3392 [Bacillus sp. JS]|nr:hypothetical protein MY9_3392 [Bacillus sp. JS]
MMKTGKYNLSYHIYPKSIKVWVIYMQKNRLHIEIGFFAINYLSEKNGLAASN